MEVHGIGGFTVKRAMRTARVVEGDVTGDAGFGLAFLWKEFRQESPDVKIIAVSGGALQGTVDLLGVARQLGATEILYKPFKTADLLAAIRRQLT